MKKTMLIVAVSATCAFGSFAQDAATNNEVRDLQPIEFSSQEELEKYAPMRIEHIKNELKSDQVSDAMKEELKALLWRFENAVVVEPKKD